MPLRDEVAPAPEFRLGGDGVGSRHDVLRRFDGIDPVSRAWIDGLRTRGGRRTEKVAELHALMTRAARLELARRRYSATAVDGRDRDDLAEEIASDALSEVINKLDSYRGATPFTTWGYGLVINRVSPK